MRAMKAMIWVAALFTVVSFAPAAKAQISFGLNIGGPPACPYGYYGYAPYSCAPPGYYGRGYFYNGIFLGVGPWANWGYGHGWGDRRFMGPDGGRFRGYGDWAGRGIYSDRYPERDFGDRGWGGGDRGWRGGDRGGRGGWRGGGDGHFGGGGRGHFGGGHGHGGGGHH